MLTPQEIAIRASRAYPSLLRAWLRGEPFSPLDLPAGAPPTDYRSLERAVAVLLEGAKTTPGYGYTVELQTRTLRKHGQQSIPVRIRIESAEDLLQLAGKHAEFAAFVADVALIRASLPALEPWLQEHAQHVIAKHGLWPELLQVCSYFCANPRPNLYIRELPIAVHTKFIEQQTAILTRLLDALLPSEALNADAKTFERRYGLRYAEPLVRLRLLDPTLRERLGLPFTDIAAPPSALATLPGADLDCIIVENKQILLTLPPMAATIALFGGGFQVELLQELPWLHQCRIRYWGDLDAQGFQILARLRGLFPHAVALMMDAATLETFHEFTVAGTPTAAHHPLPHLTPDEQALYANLIRSNLRLEQERIGHQYALRCLRG
ncbi:MAG: DUF3322 and DUF2220 domain-containing protein [Candidatus Viridilinea halotolerans]|uniref:DUF3322 and DUF2220 domain-containing protein n=1 Tax=Candidatus Viridilinea halotolerans TaxID=2491704 RepID=A0A426U6E0_9CHLR|nr:MAG: DUF3322 and DUF2220 domain-containing protein [Candidatus Viridilinea halotolerans]